MLTGKDMSEEPHDELNSLQSITTEYRMFIVEWLQIAGQELGKLFGLPLTQEQAVS